MTVQELIDLLNKVEDKSVDATDMHGFPVAEVNDMGGYIALICPISLTRPVIKG